MKKHLIYISASIIFMCSCNSDEITCEPIPTRSCNNGLLIMRSELNPATQTVFSLDSIQKPVSTPLVFNNIQTDIQPNFFNQVSRPSNYDAYNTLENTYFIEFPFEQRLYKYDIDSQTRQELIVAGFYAAPVFNNGMLYTITIDNNGYATNPANYTIETIDQNSGSLTNLTSNSFTLSSSFNWESMSSASDNNGTIYFVSGTNLIVYNTNTNTAQHTELTPNFDLTDNFQRFFGLEFRSNGKLLAIRERDDLNGEGLELVEIDTANLTATPIVIFDFMSNNIALNSEFYATTYDACDDAFYVTTINDDFLTSRFYEISLTTNTVKTENLTHYSIGIETKN